MELIDRYVYAVTRELPRAQREDVAEELRGMIEDMATDRAKGKKPSQADIVAVLKELGRPEVLALKYRQTRDYLIGPKWYGLYVKILKQLLAIVPAIIMVIVGMVALAEGKTVGETVLEALGSGLTGVVHIAFWVTAVFAVIEWSGTDIDNIAGKEWSPEELPELPKKRQISIADAVCGLALMIVFVGVVLFAISFPAAWTGATVPTLNSDLWNGWMPAFLALSAASLVLEAFKLKLGNWVPTLAAGNVVLSIAWAVFIVLLVTSQQVINPAFIAELQTRGMSANIATVASWSMAMTVIIGIFGNAWSAIDSVYKAIKFKRGEA